MAKITVIPQKVNPITHLPQNAIIKKRVAAYARVSTKQEDQANSYEAQIKHYTEYIGGRPDWIFAGMYADKGITGTSRKHRVEFNKMIDDAMNGKIDMIILKSVTRFARNTLDTVGLARQLKEKGVEIIFEENNISNFDPNGELNLTINASIAQEESRNISQNVKWGKNKRYKEGITSLAYSHFLGYDKHPTDPKKGFIINEEQAKIVRFIYQQYLRGKTTTYIASKLQEAEIKTPMGKDRWSVTTIESILKNEKYKGDARIVKTYVKDFLTHELVPNNGETESWYVEDHHDPIINPDEWEIVQAEMKRRKSLQSGYTCTNVFSSKLVCCDCGCFFGQKVWHSNDKYRRVVYRCNGKYSKEHSQCQTPVLTESEIKEKFLEAYTEFMKDKETIIQDCNEMMELVCDTADVEEKNKELVDKAKDIIVLVENLISRNATVPMDQDEFQRKYQEYDSQHKSILDSISKNEEIIAERRAKRKHMKSFINDLKNRATVLEEWNEDIWCYLIDKATVNHNGTITFQFRNGKKITK